MDNNLKENSTHGNVLFPLKVYSLFDYKGEYYKEYHWHTQLEFIYIFKGKLQITINGSLIEATENQFIFINSEELHRLNAIDNMPSIHYAIVFLPNLLNFELYDYCQNYYINPIVSKSLKFPNTIAKNDFILNEFIQIINSYNNKQLGWQLNIKASLLKIIALLIENDKLLEYNKSDNNYKFELIKTIIAFIQSNYSNKIYIEQLAKLINLNTQYFCRFFKSIMGKTPVEYINEYRIEKASELLKRTDKSIMDISFNVGFDNFSYFIKKFKEYKNCTPSKYRKTL